MTLCESFQSPLGGTRFRANWEAPSNTKLDLFPGNTALSCRSVLNNLRNHASVVDRFDPFHCSINYPNVCRPGRSTIAVTVVLCVQPTVLLQCWRYRVRMR